MANAVVALDIFRARTPLVRDRARWFCCFPDDWDHRFGWQRKIDLDARPSRLKSSSTFRSRNARPSPSRSAMKSEGEVILGASGTAKAPGLSRFSRLRGLIRRFNSNSQ